MSWQQEPKGHKSGRANLGFHEVRRLIIMQVRASRRE